MSDMPERPDEAALSELVWAWHPALKTNPKQITRGKLRILRPSGYREYTDDDLDAQDGGPVQSVDPQVHGAAGENAAAPPRPQAKRDSEPKEQN